MPRRRYGRLHSETVHGRADLCSPGEMDGVSDSGLIKRQIAVGVSSNSTALDSGVRPHGSLAWPGTFRKRGSRNPDISELLGDELYRSEGWEECGFAQKRT